MNTKEINRIVKKVVNKKSVLPILSCVCLQGDTLSVTDLELHVVIPFKSGINACIESDKFITATELMKEPTFSCDENFAINIEQGKKKIKVMGETVDNFVMLPVIDKPNQSKKFSQNDIGLIETAMNFVSTDDLRPAMTGIYIGADIAATDAHRLYWHPIDNIKLPFILPYKAATLLTMIGGEWDMQVQGSVLKDEDKKGYIDEGHVKFTNDEGVVIVSRTIAARFPKYPVVIPQGVGVALLTADIKELTGEINTAMKFSDPKTKKVEIYVKDKVVISAQDVDFGHEYSVELENVEILKKEEIEIAFNASLLTGILNLQDWNKVVKIKFYGATKAAIINGNFLIMPLMMNN